MTGYTWDPSFSQLSGSGAFQPNLTGYPPDAWVGIVDLIPGNVSRAGAGTGACPGIDLQISAMPAPGATIELVCNDVPLPGTTGALFLGGPYQTSIFGIEVLTLPAIAVPAAATGGSARQSLTMPASVTLPLNLRCQYVWLATPACSAAGPLAGSDALQFW